MFIFTYDDNYNSCITIEQFAVAAGKYFTIIKYGSQVTYGQICGGGKWRRG
jgi:hypothetical protein